MLWDEGLYRSFGKTIRHGHSSGTAAVVRLQQNNRWTVSALQPAWDEGRPLNAQQRTAKPSRRRRGHADNVGSAPPVHAICKSWILHPHRGSVFSMREAWRKFLLSIDCKRPAFSTSLVV